MQLSKLIHIVLICAFMFVGGCKDKKRRSTPSSTPTIISVNDNRIFDESFYTKVSESEGILITSTDEVELISHNITKSVVKSMLANRADLKLVMASYPARLAIASPQQEITDLPEFVNLGSNVNRFLGLTLGSTFSPVAIFKESALREYNSAFVIVHEFAHLIHMLGIPIVDGSIVTEITLAYELAMQEGLWDRTNSATNELEYFAEGAEVWFSSQTSFVFVYLEDNNFKYLVGPADLAGYDARLAIIMQKIFGENPTILQFSFAAKTVNAFAAKRKMLCKYACALSQN